MASSVPDVEFTNESQLKQQYYCKNILVAVTAVALLTINLMATRFDIKTLSLINVSVLGLGSMASLICLLQSREAAGEPDSIQDDWRWNRGTLLVATVALATCAVLSSLGLFKVFNTTAVTWTVFAPIIAGSGMVLWYVIAKCQEKIGIPYLEQLPYLILSTTMIAINILAMKGAINPTTLCVVNTALFGSCAFHSIKLEKSRETQSIRCLYALVNVAMATISALGISGHLSLHTITGMFLGYEIGYYVLLSHSLLINYYRKNSPQQLKPEPEIPPA